MGGEKSLRPYLKMQNLFVRDINRQSSPAVVRASLEKATGPLCKVVLPLDFKTDQSTHIGQAYLNFDSQAEAECCLEKIRFKLVFGRQRAKVLYAPGGTQADKDKIWGPFSYKFQIIVKNLSEEVEVEAFYEFFAKFGEILQCKTDTDSYGQYFGQVQYMETASVAAAVDGANGTRWHGAVIQVVPHHKAAQAESFLPMRSSADVPNASSFPALGASSSAAASTAASSRPAAHSHLQQQQQPPRQQEQPQQPQPQQQHVRPNGVPASAPAPVNFAVQVLEGSGGSGNVLSLADLDSPVSRPLAAFSGSGGDLHIGAPVVEPVAAPVVAPIGSHGVLPAEQPRLTQKEFTTATTGPGARIGPGAASAGMGRLSLLDRILMNRAEAATVTPVAAAMSPVGPDVGYVVGHAGQPGTPKGVTVGARVNGGRKKGGLIKSVAQAVEQVSELLCCPITHEVLRDPVVAADGITYERHAISSWLTSHATSPMTNMPLSNLELHPNNLVRTLIEELM